METIIDKVTVFGTSYSLYVWKNSNISSYTVVRTRNGTIDRIWNNEPADRIERARLEVPLCWTSGISLPYFENIIEEENQKQRAERILNRPSKSSKTLLQDITKKLASECKVPKSVWGVQPNATDKDMLDALERFHQGATDILNNMGKTDPLANHIPIYSIPGIMTGGAFVVPKSFIKHGLLSEPIGKWVDNRIVLNDKGKELFAPKWVQSEVTHVREWWHRKGLPKYLHACVIQRNDKTWHWFITRMPDAHTLASGNCVNLSQGQRAVDDLLKVMLNADNSWTRSPKWEDCAKYWTNTPNQHNVLMQRNRVPCGWIVYIWQVKPTDDIRWIVSKADDIDDFPYCLNYSTLASGSCKSVEQGQQIIDALLDILLEEDTDE